MTATATAVAERTYIWPRTAAERLANADVSTVYRWIRKRRLGSIRISERKMKVCARCVELIATRGNGAQAQCECRQAQLGSN